jgi:hypothetical protein
MLCSSHCRLLAKRKTRQQYKTSVATGEARIIIALPEVVKWWKTWGAKREEGTTRTPRAPRLLLFEPQRREGHKGSRRYFGVWEEGIVEVAMEVGYAGPGEEPGEVAGARGEGGTKRGVGGETLDAVDKGGSIAWRDEEGVGFVLEGGPVGLRIGDCRLRISGVGGYDGEGVFEDGEEAAPAEGCAVGVG